MPGIRGSWLVARGVAPVDRRQQKDTGAGLRAAPCAVPPGNVGLSTDSPQRGNQSPEPRAGGSNRVAERLPGPVRTPRSGITRTRPQKLRSQNQKLGSSHRYTERV